MPEETPKDRNGQFESKRDFFRFFSDGTSGW